jgi:hypothetical protein
MKKNYFSKTIILIIMALTMPCLSLESVAQSNGDIVIIYTPSGPYHPRTPLPQDSDVVATLNTITNSLQLTFNADLGETEITITGENGIVVTDCIYVDNGDNYITSLANCTSGYYTISVYNSEGRRYSGAVYIYTSD